jgi:hypothetical protein
MVADFALLYTTVTPTRPILLVSLLMAHALVPLTFGTNKALTLRRAGRVTIVPATVSERRLSWRDMTPKIAGPMLGAAVGALLTWLLLAK